MKRILLLLMLCMSMTSFAQTTWTGLGANTNWNNTDNWNTNAVPTASDDVIIPNGSDVNINVSSFVKSIVVQGTSTVTMNQSLSFTDASSFSANTTVTWNNSSFYGGGTLTNNGTVNLITNGSRYISGATTVINNGVFTMPSGGYLYLYDTAVFNNTVSGIFDLQSDAYINYSGSTHNFVNAGTLKKSGGLGSSLIYTNLTNTGTISVESGTIDMYYLGKNFNGGVYNVSSGSTLLVSTTGMNVSGTLTGTLDGALNWTGNFSVATTATFDFTGQTGVTWTSGSLLGGGTLINESNISLTANGSRYISGGTTLTNNGTVTMPDGGYLYLYDTSIFNNALSGVFDLHSDANINYSGNTHEFVNSGLLKKTGGSDTSYIYTLLTNTGTISVESGTIDMYYFGKNFNGGVYNVSSGSTLLVSTTGMNVSGTLTGTLDGPLKWTGNFSVASAATFNFTGATGVNWNSGSLLGGGTLTNASNINLTTNGSRYISGGTTLDNEGTVTMPDGGSLYMYDTSVFNNTVSGIFDLHSDANINYSGSTHEFVNSGLLKKTGGLGTAYIYTILTNTGTISVESGTIDMYYYGKNFNGGVYNVSSGSTLLVSTTGMNVSGTLTGTLDGPMKWTGNFSVASAATFNFTGATGVNWNSGSLLGGGTLTNASTINLSSNGSRYISGTVTKLVNTGLITMPVGGYLYLYDDTSIDNQATGVIDFQSDATIHYSGSGAFNITNEGLIKKTAGTGVTYVYPPVTNSGIIDASSGTLSFVDAYGLTNTVDGIIKGTATIDLPSDANFTNDGTFAPGGSPGTLTVLGNYKSSSTSVLDVELNGLTQGTEYDLLAITGNNVIFDGDVNVTMGFEGNIGDTFTVATTSGTIATENLTTPVIAVYLGKQYTFDVTYPGDNSVLLTISGKLDIEPPMVLTQNITVQLDSSGNTTFTTAQIDNGSTDNCTLQANLIYALDVTSFTCANLGGNTVSLTVTDEAGNSASADATVTVEDSMNPTVATQNVTVQLDSSGNASVTTNDIDNGSTDNCTVSGLSLDVTAFTCADLGDNTVMLTVTDQSGNSASASATVTVEDSMAPTVATQNVTVQLDSSGNASITTNDIDNGSTDNCTVSGLSLDITDFTCADIGDKTVMLTVTDQSGNSASASATVTVEDNIAPIVICRGDAVVSEDTGYTVPDYYANNEISVTDNCTGFSVVQTPAPGSVINANGDTTVTLTATDASGNVGSCSFNLNVTLGVNDFQLSDANIVLFPNPTQHSVTIKNNSHLQLISASVIDISGRLLSVTDLKGMTEHKEISLDAYANGTYFIKIDANNSSIVKQIVKK